VCYNGIEETVEVVISSIIELSECVEALIEVGR
jgi:hypothetical protein